MTCSDPALDQAGIELTYSQRPLASQRRASCAWCSVSHSVDPTYSSTLVSVAKGGSGGGGGGCCLSLAEAGQGPLPCAVLNTPSCFPGRTRAEAHADRVWSSGRGDTSPAGGDQQHTCESSEV